MHYEKKSTVSGSLTKFIDNSHQVYKTKLIQFRTSQFSHTSPLAVSRQLHWLQHLAKYQPVQQHMGRHNSTHSRIAKPSTPQHRPMPQPAPQPHRLNSNFHKAPSQAIHQCRLHRVRPLQQQIPPSLKVIPRGSPHSTLLHTNSSSSQHQHQHRVQVLGTRRRQAIQGQVLASNTPHLKDMSSMAAQDSKLIIHNNTLTIKMLPV